MIKLKAAIVAALILLPGCATLDSSALADNCISVDVSAYQLDIEQGIVSALIEIPAGSREKWEVDKATFSQVCWEQKNGELRVIDYLGYPANYGAIPGTLAAKDVGGDGDPLDILVLGDPLPRGMLAQIAILGMLSMQDDGEDDHKLIGKVVGDHTFAGVEDLATLQQRMPELTTILRLWFANYKGPDGNVSGLELHDRDLALDEIQRNLR